MTRHTVGCPSASSIEVDQAAERRQLSEEGGNFGVLPCHFNVTAETIEEEEVGGPVPQYLVGNVGIPDGEVLGSGGCMRPAV